MPFWISSRGNELYPCWVTLMLYILALTTMLGPTIHVNFPQHMRGYHVAAGGSKATTISLNYLSAAVRTGHVAVRLVACQAQRIPARQPRSLREHSHTVITYSFRQPVFTEIIVMSRVLYVCFHCSPTFKSRIARLRRTQHRKD